MQGTELPTKHPEEAAGEVKVIERIGGYYEAQEVPFGVVYTWHPGYVLLECSCSEKLALTCSTTTCRECGTDHTAVVREELAEQCFEDEVFHPWHYAGEREGLGLPY